MYLKNKISFKNFSQNYCQFLWIQCNKKRIGGSYEMPQSASAVSPKNLRGMSTFLLLTEELQKPTHWDVSTYITNITAKFLTSNYFTAHIIIILYCVSTYISFSFLLFHHQHLLSFTHTNNTVHRNTKMYLKKVFH